MVQAIPEGVSPVVPHLSIRGAKKAIEFYEAAFGAEVVMIMPMGDDLVGYADLRVAGSRIYLADAMPGWGPVQSPGSLKGTSVALHLWVEDVDAFFARAVEAGAKVVMPVADQFWGDRYGMVSDPFGHVWAIATRKEDLTSEEMLQRGQEAMANMPPPPPPPAPAPKPKPRPRPKKKGLPPSLKPKAPAKPAPKPAAPKARAASKPATAPKAPEAEEQEKLKKAKKDKKEKKAKKSKHGKKSKKDKKRKKKSKR